MLKRRKMKLVWYHYCCIIFYGNKNKVKKECLQLTYGDETFILCNYMPLVYRVSYKLKLSPGRTHKKIFQSLVPENMLAIRKIFYDNHFICRKYLTFDPYLYIKLFFMMTTILFWKSQLMIKCMYHFLTFELVNKITYVYEYDPS